MLSDSDIRERLGPIADPSFDPQQPPPSRPPGGLIAALVILVLALWCCGVGLIWHLERISPHVPDAPSGHVYRFTDTRHTVYLTVNERYAAWAAIGGPILGTIGVAIFSLRRKTVVELG